MSILCAQWGYSRQAYYKDLRCMKEMYYINDQVLAVIGAIRSRQPRVGGLKLWQMLNKGGIPVGRDKVFRLLGEKGLLVNPRKKRVYTTDSSGWLRQFPNRVKGLKITRENQVVVSDITYIQVGEGFDFLSLITDAYSRYILGHELHATLDTTGVSSALDQALERIGKGKAQGMIHHSDRGCQYCSGDYVKKLKTNGIKPSTTQDGSPYDNAIAERVNGILKTEWIDMEKFKDIEQARERISEIIDIYNNERLHASVNWNTPAEVYYKKKDGTRFIMF